MIAFSVVNLPCNGGTNGAIDMTVTGGTAPYSYLWSNGATTEDISGLSSTTYTITVTDANSCTKAVSILLTQPPPINPTVSVTHVTCYGGSNGAVDLTVSGGTGVLLVSVVEWRYHTRPERCCGRHLYCDCNGCKLLY